MKKLGAVILVLLALSMTGCSWKEIGSVAGAIEKSGCKNFGGC